MPRTHRPDLSLCVKPTPQTHKHLARGIGPLVATQFFSHSIVEPIKESEQRLTEEVQKKNLHLYTLSCRPFGMMEGVELRLHLLDKLCSYNTSYEKLKRPL